MDINLAAFTTHEELRAYADREVADAQKSGNRGWQIRANQLSLLVDHIIKEGK